MIGEANLPSAKFVSNSLTRLASCLESLGRFDHLPLSSCSSADLLPTFYLVCASAKLKKYDRGVIFRKSVGPVVVTFVVAATVVVVVVSVA